jgi:leader peptidase (prepilin peptidase) / N-methyltransferase
LPLKRRRAGVDKEKMDFAVPLVFLPGLAIGSFLGVVAARVPLRRSVVHPGSACMSCEAPIRWYDNVPVLSYALLRGRCRKCGIRIPPRDLAIELATALLLVACVVAFGFTLHAAAAGIACGALVVVTATDLERRIVPNLVVLPAAATVLALQTASHPSPAWALGAVGAAGFLFLAALAYPGGMGMGDVKLALLIGALLGRTTPVGLLLGMFLALVPSIVLLARHGARARRIAIPFAPFLAAGAVVALFTGNHILHAYLGVLK